MTRRALLAVGMAALVGVWWWRRRGAESECGPGLGCLDRGGHRPIPEPVDEYVPMAAWLPQTMTVRLDTVSGDVTTTVREMWRN